MELKEPAMELHAVNIEVAENTPLPDSAHNREYFDHLKKINDVFYDQIKMADQKAAYIFTFLLAFLISSADGRGVFTVARYAESGTAVMLTSALLALSSVFSVISAILVILPRRNGHGTTLFWGTWERGRSEFIAAARKQDMAYLFSQYLENVDTLSAIARSKYRFVGFAFHGLVVTVLSYVLLLAQR